jgi:hypothetical protein
MKKVWKWILGIIIVLVVLAVLFALAFMFHNGFGRSISFREFPQSRVWNGPMMGGGDGWHRPGMGVRGFMPFGMVFAFLGGLIPLALLGLLVYGAYRLGKKRANIAMAIPAAPAPVAAPTHNCAKCGQPVQEDWKNCPYCGKKQ